MSNCENCTQEYCESERKLPETIPYIAHEGEVNRLERANKRISICLVISIILLFLSNIIWLYSWMQYDYTSEEVIIESADGGNANYIGQDGNIYNGENNSSEEEAHTSESEI